MLSDIVAVLYYFHQFCDGDEMRQFIGLVKKLQEHPAVMPNLLETINELCEEVLGDEP